MLGFVSRTLCKQVFISLVKPHLEYCSSVWNQLANKYVSEIEAIQSRAARLILQRYHYTMYMRGLCHNLTTYTVHGREWRGEEILWASASWTKSQQPSMHSTHDCHQHATYHPEKMLVIPSCNQLYQKSYYLCTLSAWNALPKNTIHVTSLDALHWGTGFFTCIFFKRTNKHALQMSNKVLSVRCTSLHARYGKRFSIRDTYFLYLQSTFATKGLPCLNKNRINRFLMKSSLMVPTYDHLL